jgi:hypothetical protein
MPSFWVVAQHSSSDYEEEFSYWGSSKEDVMKKLQTNGYDVIEVTQETSDERDT